jgi:hypothetical protein
VVKPHLVLDGAAGLVLDSVLDHFEITAAQLFMMDKVAAAEFYEVGAGCVSTCIHPVKVRVSGVRTCERRTMWPLQLSLLEGGVGQGLYRESTVACSSAIAVALVNCAPVLVCVTCLSG